jgi:hypothetical protein
MAAACVAAGVKKCKHYEEAPRRISGIRFFSAGIGNRTGATRQLVQLESHRRGRCGRGNRAGRRSGIVCADMGTTKLQTAQWYDLSFDARTDTPKTFALTVSLESPDGKTVSARTTLPEVGGTNWAHYSVALHIRQPSSKCRMVITLADTGSIWLNGISFVLRKTTATN